MELKKLELVIQDPLCKDIDLAPRKTTRDEPRPPTVNPELHKSIVQIPRSFRSDLRMNQIKFARGNTIQVVIQAINLHLVVTMQMLVGFKSPITKVDLSAATYAPKSK
jgi:hypothetical protein